MRPMYLTLTVVLPAFKARIVPPETEATLPFVELHEQSELETVVPSALTEHVLDSPIVNVTDEGETDNALGTTFALFEALGLPPLAALIITFTFVPDLPAVNSMLVFPMLESAPSTETSMKFE